MRITVNGERREVRAGLTAEELLRELGVVTGRVAVELNRHVVPRKELSTRKLCDGDELEIVTFVGGGSDGR